MFDNADSPKKVSLAETTCTKFKDTCTVTDLAPPKKRPRLQPKPDFVANTILQGNVTMYRISDDGLIWQ